MLVIALAGLALQAPAAPLFTEPERAAIVAYWSQPGIYAVSAPPEATTRGPWDVRLTPDGSRWLWTYQRSIGKGKTPPTQDVKAGGDRAAWETWIDARVTYDRAVAQAAADLANAQALGRKEPKPTAPSHPGLPPAGLLEAFGPPPALAACVAPLCHTIRMPGSESITYVDHTRMRPRYAYYRSDAGVMSSGTPLGKMKSAELDALFRKCGMTETERKVMRAVSILEGGFDAVNTYDTGWVSIGFIQFITGEAGNGSLLEVLQREKADDAMAYEADFHHHGIDVSPTGILVAVDPSSGAELVGPEAVRAVVQDKRLTALFQRAGRESDAFRCAQVKVAKSHYWAADDLVAVTIAGQVVQVRAGDVIQSEAGLATLYDRKVNTGSVAALGEAIGKVVAAHGLADAAAARGYEREIVALVTYRHNYLEDRSLGQPR